MGFTGYREAESREIAEAESQAGLCDFGAGLVMGKKTL